ncbi:hemolysin, partial [Paraburkholderia xenovorans]|uniref:calcium-binding protein n=1 Tax=Paraburkholderia xenovorans TaxID=36873 RepID=UPI0038B72A00
DTFVFNAGYGHLEISESYSGAAQPVLQLGAGISASSLTVRATSNGYGLVLTDSVSGDQITLDNMLFYSGYGVQSVQFADGRALTGQQLIQMETIGTAANDTLYGTASADVFDGKGGTDIETGRGGSDTYVLQQGYGALTIVNGISSSNGAAGNLSIQGANPNEIWLQRVGNNLQVDLMGSTTEATIQNWFSNTYSQLGNLTVSGGSAGTLTLDAQINQLIQAMATFSGNNPGFDPTSTAHQTITDPTALAAVNTAWH